MTRSVLIVDDDPFIRRLIATTLEDVAGFEIAEAGDGLEAIAAARELDPAIVFLDIDMPRMNGIEACRELRTIADGTIVMLTAAGPEAEAEARRRRGPLPLKAFLAARPASAGRLARRLT
jgi:CheY-like chemotaxis protein